MSQVPSGRAPLRALGIIFPVISVLMAAPITVGAFGSPPGASRSLLVAPTALAVIAAPGHLRAVVAWSAIPRLSLGERIWVRTSFALGLVAAGIGAVIGLAFILPSLSALATAAIVLAIWRRLEARTG